MNNKNLSSIIFDKYTQDQLRKLANIGIAYYSSMMMSGDDLENSSANFMVFVLCEAYKKGLLEVFNKEESLNIKNSYGAMVTGLEYTKGKKKITESKKLYAEAIDQLNGLLIEEEAFGRNEEKIKMLKTAIQETQTAQMWAARAIGF
jgi:hypothetical protein